MTGEWGPWVEHDGKGCPLANGDIYEAEYADGDFEVGVRGSWFEIGGMGRAVSDDGSWLWWETREPIIRYRIRKPRCMAILQELIQDLPPEATP